MHIFDHQLSSLLILCLEGERLKFSKLVELLNFDFTFMAIFIIHCLIMFAFKNIPQLQTFYPSETLFL